MEVYKIVDSSTGEFVKSNVPPVETTNIEEEAFLFSAKSKCEGFLNNVDKTNKSLYKIEPVEYFETVKFPSEYEMNTSSGSNMSYVVKEDNISLMSFIDWYRGVLNGIKEETKHLSELDKEEQDILHYIEFNDFNASDGYKICKVLKGVREQRRICKIKLTEYDKIKLMVNEDKLRDLIEYNTKVLTDMHYNWRVTDNPVDKFNNNCNKQTEEISEQCSLL